jgi:hypothetical protein
VARVPATGLAAVDEHALTATMSASTVRGNRQDASRPSREPTGRGSELLGRRFASAANPSVSDDVRDSSDRDDARRLAAPVRCEVCASPFRSDHLRLLWPPRPRRMDERSRRQEPRLDEGERAPDEALPEPTHDGPHPLYDDGKECQRTVGRPATGLCNSPMRSGRIGQSTLPACL